MKPSLVIMAAGMGSRYGGFKQIEPVGPSGEIIMEYSIYDAKRAGFDKVVFIIKKEMEDSFRENIGRKIEKIIDTAYAFQDTADLPQGFTVPSGRIKPWGTAHAVLSAKNCISSPFAVINADDFYGASSFEMLGSYLQQEHCEDEYYQYCMVGYELCNTLTEKGYVARGICHVDNEYLTNIVEHTHIEKDGYNAKFTEDGHIYMPLKGDSKVSMNAWGFTASILQEIEERFPKFLREEDISKAEFFLPSVVDMLIKEKKARVKVLPCRERWFGVTYKEDRASVVKAIYNMTANGIYPESLWGH